MLAHQVRLDDLAYHLVFDDAHNAWQQALQALQIDWQVPELLLRHDQDGVPRDQYVEQGVIHLLAPQFEPPNQCRPNQCLNRVMKSRQQHLIYLPP